MRLHWESSVHKKTALQLICLHSHLCLPSTATAWQIGSLLLFMFCVFQFFLPLDLLVSRFGGTLLDLLALGFRSQNLIQIECLSATSLPSTGWVLLWIIAECVNRAQDLLPVIRYLVLLS